MNIYFDRLLAEFVDREIEMDQFRGVLDDPDARVFVVWGPGGVGKSSLQAKMKHEVANRGLRKAEVIWTETRNHDLMAITRSIRDDLGPEPFTAFTDLINYMTVAQYELKVTLAGEGSIRVAESAVIRDSTIGDIVGVKIEDVMLSEPRRDLQISESERRARLTDAFLDGAARTLRDREAVIFFDATEKMSAETENWVWNDLLPAACDGRMGRVKLVLCGRKQPVVNRLYNGIIEVAELRPLSLEHILSYLARRGVHEAERKTLAKALLIQTEGNMLQLATMVDAFLKFDDGLLPSTAG